jgi:hypothetical protein
MTGEKNHVVLETLYNRAVDASRRLPHQAYQITSMLRALLKRRSMDARPLNSNNKRKSVDGRVRGDGTKFRNEEIKRRKEMHVVLV